LINASKVVGKDLSELTIVINGSGAAGIAIAKMLAGINDENREVHSFVKELILCDTVGILSHQREDLNEMKKSVLSFSNKKNIDGDVFTAIKDADVFIGVSKGNLLTSDDIASMNKNAIVFALANPIPEIMPEEAIKGGAAIVGTGRSDLPNQINNVLGFPGIFRGALDGKAKRITTAMKIAAAYAIAEMVENPTSNFIIPPALDKNVAINVAKAVKAAIK
jgi:malate dehydrogenase (oxaloacetate-decarboxylating)